MARTWTSAVIYSALVTIFLHFAPMLMPSLASQADFSFESGTKFEESTPNFSIQDRIKRDIRTATSETMWMTNVTVAGTDAYQSAWFTCNADILTCVCYGCNVYEADSNFTCCQNLLEQSQLQDGVIMTLWNFTREQYDSAFETKFKVTISDALVKFCTTNGTSCGVKDSVTPSAIFKPEKVIIISLNESLSNPSHFEVGFLVLIANGTGKARRKRGITTGSYHASADALRVARSVSNDGQVVSYQLLLATILEERDYIQAMLSVAVNPKARRWLIVPDYNRTPTTQQNLAGIIVGGIVGSIFAIICLISAVKAVRDRRRIKARRAAKKKAREEAREIIRQQKEEQARNEQRMRDALLAAHPGNHAYDNPPPPYPTLLMANGKPEPNGYTVPSQVVEATVHPECVQTREPNDRTPELEVKSTTGNHTTNGFVNMGGELDSPNNEEKETSDSVSSLNNVMQNKRANSEKHGFLDKADMTNGVISNGVKNGLPMCTYASFPREKLDKNVTGPRGLAHAPLVYRHSYEDAMYSKFGKGRKTPEMIFSNRKSRSEEKMAAGTAGVYRYHGDQTCFDNLAFDENTVLN